MPVSVINQRLITLVLVVAILWFGKPFLIPLAYAFLIALVLFPMCRYLEDRGAGRALSILLPILLLSALFAGLVALLSYELVILAGKWPLVQQQFDPFLDRVQHQLESAFGWTTEKQVEWARDQVNKWGENAGSWVKVTLTAAVGAVFNLIIIPIYVALILIYRDRLARFVIAIAPQRYQDRLPEVIRHTVRIFSRFIRGMVVVYVIVGLLNTIGLWAIGVETPFTYGMITAIMTIIPYFGIIISGAIPIVVTWLETSSLWQPVAILAVFTVVQYLEANLIFPYVVGRFVDLNTLAAIVAIFMGALIWGVSGMILFLPLFAVFRLVASHFPDLKPWEDLLGK
ncbi:MAG: AI-2E family transporter [Saprospiraceae bacterium]|nr:AI-2E family transporter [Saprospiraceae bacterium]